jgi:hypothetical protein
MITLTIDEVNKILAPLGEMQAKYSYEAIALLNDKVAAYQQALNAKTDK